MLVLHVDERGVEDDLRQPAQPSGGEDGGRGSHLRARLGRYGWTLGPSGCPARERGEDSQRKVANSAKGTER